MTRRLLVAGLAAFAALAAPALAEGDGKDAKAPKEGGEAKDGKGPRDPKDGKEPARGGRREAREDREKLTLEQFASFDKSGDGVLRGDEVPNGWAARFDRDGDGNVSRTEFAEINSRPEKLRRLHPMRDARARAADALRMFDQDKDGAVQRDEYPGDDHVFRRADRSRNGALEPNELLGLAEDELDDIRRQMRNPGRNEFLSLFDIDRDNAVGADEYDGPVAAFRKHDTDSDGTVTYYELYPERMMRAGREPEPVKPEKVSAVQALDKDGDGKVARAEFPGNDTAWRRLDTNGDGWVTAADAR